MSMRTFCFIWLLLSAISMFWNLQHTLSDFLIINYHLSEQIQEPSEIIFHGHKFSSSTRRLGLPAERLRNSLDVIAPLHCLLLLRITEYAPLVAIVMAHN